MGLVQGVNYRGDRGVNFAIREISDNAWLIGDQILLSRTSTPEPASVSWPDGHGGHYSISDPPNPPPDTRPLRQSSAIKMVYFAGDVSAVFEIGDAFCKIRIVDKPQKTREHATLEWLRQRIWSFTIPDVLFHVESDDRYYLILSRVPGKTLSAAWPSMDEDMRDMCSRRVADIVQGMALPAETGCRIAGVDGGQLEDLFLADNDKNCSPESLSASAERLTMDTSSLFFYHCDLGPGNVLVDLMEGNKIGIVDWETAGYVPREWIRTKFRVSGGMDLTQDDGHVPWAGGDPADYRKRVIRILGDMGYADVLEQWKAHNM